MSLENRTKNLNQIQGHLNENWTIRPDKDIPCNSMILESPVDDRGRINGIEFTTAAHFRANDARNFFKIRLALDSGFVSILGYVDPILRFLTYDTKLKTIILFSFQ